MQPREPDDRAAADGRRSPADLRLAEELRVARRELDRRTRQLERSEARFRDVIEGHADALVVVDGSGAVRFVNGRAVRLFGKRREELVGSFFGFPVVDGETTEVDLLVRGVPQVAEMRVVRSEWEGDTAYIASLRDITERKRAEQDARRLIREQAARVAAEESAHRMRFLLETSTVLSASLEYNATMSALARLCVSRMADWAVVYGLTNEGQPHRLAVAHRDESFGPLTRELKAIPIPASGAHPVLEVLKTRRARVVANVTDDVLAQMTATPRELEIVRQLGVSSFMLVPMVARGRPLGALAFVCSQDDRPFVGGDVALAEDVARRAALAVENAQLYAEAQRANQSKTDFLAIVSHDLRTPLTAIIGYAELLEMGVPEPIPEASRERVSRIRTSARHQLYLLNELLAFARLEGGNEKVQPTQLDAREVVRDVAEVVEQLAKERGLDFEVETPEAAVTITSDPDKLRQILLNLASNAVRYTERGKVRVALRHAVDELLLEVSDTGNGISKEHMNRIFEPFWQVDPTQRAHGGGTGLGLSVVKRLCELLGGVITVESEPGAGSTFVVRLRTAMT
jgi:signal transduction histidine kinase